MTRGSFLNALDEAGSIAELKYWIADLELRRQAPAQLRNGTREELLAEAKRLYELPA